MYNCSENGCCTDRQIAWRQSGSWSSFTECALGGFIVIMQGHLLRDKICSLPSHLNQFLTL
jgi:hypothetical protein